MRERCRDVGVAAYLTKPIKQSDLFDTIFRYCTLPRRNIP